MEKRYLILKARDYFGEIAMVTEELFKAAKGDFSGTPYQNDENYNERNVDLVSEKTLRILYEKDSTGMSYEELKNELDHFFPEYDVQPLVYLIGNISYRNKLPDGCAYFKSLTEMVDYIQKNNIKIVDDAH